MNMHSSNFPRCAVMQASGFNVLSAGARGLMTRDPVWPVPGDAGGEPEGEASRDRAGMAWESAANRRHSWVPQWWPRCSV